MRRAALIVGVDQYRDRQILSLEYARQDAISLAGFLEHKAGYELVRTLLDPEDRQVELEADRLVGSLGAGDFFLFFFAGHGVEFNGRHLLLCPAAEPKTLEFYRQVVPVDLLKKRSNKPGLTRAFILDACRNDLFKSRAVGPGSGFTGTAILREMVMTKEASRSGALSILCSCDEGLRAHEVPQLRHGLFTQALMDEMDDALRNGRELRLSDDLKLALKRRMTERALHYGLAGTEQRPWLSNSDAPPVLLAGQTSIAEGKIEVSGIQTKSVRLSARKINSTPVRGKPAAQASAPLFWIHLPRRVGIPAILGLLLICGIWTGQQTIQQADKHIHEQQPQKAIERLQQGWFSSLFARGQRARLMAIANRMADLQTANALAREGEYIKINEYLRRHPEDAEFQLAKANAITNYLRQAEQRVRNLLAQNNFLQAAQTCSNYIAYEQFKILLDETVQKAIHHAAAAAQTGNVVLVQGMLRIFPSQPELLISLRQAEMSRDEMAFRQYLQAGDYARAMEIGQRYPPDAGAFKDLRKQALGFALKEAQDLIPAGNVEKIRQLRRFFPADLKLREMESQASLELRKCEQARMDYLDALKATDLSLVQEYGASEFEDAKRLAQQAASHTNDVRDGIKCYRDATARLREASALSQTRKSEAIAAREKELQAEERRRQEMKEKLRAVLAGVWVGYHDDDYFEVVREGNGFRVTRYSESRGRVIEADQNLAFRVLNSRWNNEELQWSVHHPSYRYKGGDPVFQVLGGKLTESAKTKYYRTGSYDGEVLMVEVSDNGVDWDREDRFRKRN